MAWRIGLIFYIVILTYTCRCSDPNQEVEDIINYRDATIEEFPYQASIRFWDLHICSASIISNRHVITVAHCFQRPNIDFHTLEGWTVVTSTSSQFKKGKTYGIVPCGVYYHKSFRTEGDRYFHDIAVVKLDGIIHFNKVQQKLNLPEHEIEDGATVNLTAWEWSNRNDRHDGELVTIETNILSRGECKNSYLDITQQVQESEVCTPTGNGAIGCRVDTGSPLVANNQLVGIFSWNGHNNDCASGYPDVFANVFYYKNAIIQYLAASP